MMTDSATNVHVNKAERAFGSGLGAAPPVTTEQAGPHVLSGQDQPGVDGGGPGGRLGCPGEGGDGGPPAQRGERGGR
eukprot:scaffold9063_cov45-Prasinocladus_malaysianus.AAC.1